jgi:hypothetical protein
MDPHPRVVVALERVKGLFLEMPQTRLTLAETSRACGIDADLCEGLLAALADVRFLQRDQRGIYSRRFLDTAA